MRNLKERRMKNKVKPSKGKKLFVAKYELLEKWPEYSLFSGE